MIKITVGERGGSLSKFYSETTKWNDEEAVQKVIAEAIVTDGHQALFTFLDMVYAVTLSGDSLERYLYAYCEQGWPIPFYSKKTTEWTRTKIGHPDSDEEPLALNECFFTESFTLIGDWAKMYLANLK